MQGHEQTCCRFINTPALKESLRARSRSLTRAFSLSGHAQRAGAHPHSCSPPLPCVCNRRGVGRWDASLACRLECFLARGKGTFWMLPTVSRCRLRKTQRCTPWHHYYRLRHRRRCVAVVVLISIFGATTTVVVVFITAGTIVFVIIVALSAMSNCSVALARPSCCRLKCRIALVKQHFQCRKRGTPTHDHWHHYYHTHTHTHTHAHAPHRLTHSPMSPTDLRAEP